MKRRIEAWIRAVIREELAAHERTLAIKVLRTVDKGTPDTDRAAS